MNKENVNHESDLVKINDLSLSHPIIIDAHLLNQYYHTLLGNPFQRLKYYDPITEQYCFYRTPGIINYIITYYLHHGYLSSELHYPSEIVYDELVFFGFNIQVIYDVVSNSIAIDYFIPSNPYRRAFWMMFISDLSRLKYYLTRFIRGLILICSIITSILFIEIINHPLKNDYFTRILLIRKMLTVEIFIFLFSFIEVFIYYLIRPRLRLPTIFFVLINIISMMPLALLLYVWSLPPDWLYNLIVIQLAARIFRSIRLSSHAYEVMSNLTDQLSIYVEPFQSIALIILFFALFILSFEQISTPAEFLIIQHENRTKCMQSLGDVIWISFNAFTSLGEGTSRPLTYSGLTMEFLSCFIGFLITPYLVQNVYTITSNTIDRQNTNKDKRKQNYLVRIEDEYEHRAIGQVTFNERGHANLPEILIQRDEF